MSPKLNEDEMSLEELASFSFVNSDLLMRSDDGRVAFVNMMREEFCLNCGSKVVPCQCNRDE